MRIQDRPEFESKPKPVTATPTDSVGDVVARMAKNNHGATAIVDNKSQVLGIFSERDLMRRVVAPGKDLKSTPISEVMTSEVRTANASDDVVAWLRQMSNERFRHVPVVDDDGKLVHMMSQGDFVSYTWPELRDRIKEEVTYAYPKLSSPLWLFTGIAVYTIIIIIVLRAAF